ncbi:MAG TPA: hypothetical protein VER12_13295 [Polyangiaceae bacterium]|nr:hypothetical protein [Polyangiaceae bacterium]
MLAPRTLRNPLWTLPFLLLALGCKGNDTEMRMRCQQQGLQLGGSEHCTSWVNTLEGTGHSQFFTSGVLPSSVVTIHVSGQAWVARGALALSFTDREGKTQTMQVKPGEPTSFEGNLRAGKSEEEAGFFLSYSPAFAQAKRADGLVVELTFRQANFNLPGG